MKFDEDTIRHPERGVRKMFPTVAATLGEVCSCGRELCWRQLGLKLRKLYLLHVLWSVRILFEQTSYVYIIYFALIIMCIFSYWRYNPLWVCILQPSSGAIASSRTRFLDHTQRRATVGRTPLDEWSIRRRDLYLTTHNTHDRHPCPRWDSNPRSQQASGRRPTP